MLNPVTRKAIIIGAPGDNQRSKFLAGVEPDCIAIKNFFLSTRGGSFYSHEIEVLWNPTSKEVQKTIQSTYAEYCAVYFTGHGYLNSRNRKQVLCLKDGDIEENLLFSNSPKQLIVLDSCRNYVSTGIGAIPQKEEEFLNFTGSPDVRQLFDNYIRKSPNGKIVIYGTQPGFFSWDSPMGGHFTRALVNVCSTVNGDLSFHTIEQVLPTIRLNLQNDKSKQVPCIRKYGEPLLPFVVGMPKATRTITTKKPIPVHYTEEANWANVAVGVIALFVIGAALSK